MEVVWLFGNGKEADGSAVVDLATLGAISVTLTRNEPIV